jgi:hypothetical protein
VIHYLACGEHVRTLRPFLGRWAPDFAERIELVPYEVLMGRTRLRPGTYVFSDVERLDPEATRRLTELWERLSETEGFRLVNHPSRSMRRYELLRMLRERGSNRFGLYRLDEERSALRYPVFLRGENDHRGSRTPLLGDPAELAAALLGLRRRMGSLDGVVVVEFCDTSDPDGVFRKYAAYCVAGRILPIHLMFSRRWMVKSSVGRRWRELREERAYVEGNPHEERLREIFRWARIDYGRIDYGVLDGSIQTWEINTNPTLLPRRGAGLRRRRVRRHFLERFRAALSELEGPRTEGPEEFFEVR